jgi:hypothetical protein
MGNLPPSALGANASAKILSGLLPPRATCAHCGYLGEILPTP